jgi:hypothetical protein
MGACRGPQQVAGRGAVTTGELGTGLPSGSAPPSRAISCVRGDKSPTALPPPPPPPPPPPAAAATEHKIAQGWRKSWAKLRDSGRDFQSWSKQWAKPCGPGRTA